MVASHVVVHGQVQGVFFRANAVETATELGGAGWVSNRDDGAVEMLLEGDDTAVERMIAWAREGPGGAAVDGVDVTDRPASGLTGFDQR